MPKPGDHEQERRRKHERERQRHEHEHEKIGDDPKRHTEIIARRWSGSPPPTFDRYAKALKQWRALPGAVKRSADTTKDEGKQ